MLIILSWKYPNRYSKTKSGLATAGQKTSSAFNTFGSAVSKKLGDMRESNTFKSFEEKVSSATNSIKVALMICLFLKLQVIPNPPRSEKALKENFHGLRRIKPSRCGLGSC